MAETDSELRTIANEWLRFHLAVEESHCPRQVEYTAMSIWHERGIGEAIRYITKHTTERTA